MTKLYRTLFCGPETNTARDEATSRIAEEIRKDIVREKMTSREIVASYKRVAKAIGMDIDIEAIYLAVEDGSM